MSEGQAAEAFLRRAREALNEMQLRHALRLFRDAEVAGYDPDICAAGRWTCHMLCGEFEQAWQESDAIERRGRPDPHRFWDGRPFRGKHVMIRCLHGLGDTIQFARFVPLIREQAETVTVEAQPGLKSLLAQAGIADHVITWGEREPFWNQQIEINELPKLFRVTESTIPPAPYLPLSALRGARTPNGTGKRKVGLVWSASAYNPLRSIPLHQLAPLLDLPGFSFYSLQAGPACQELRPWNGRIPNLAEHAADVLETAVNMSAMDLVITVDTMTAHLGGALGLPTWILLPFACDWRWMAGRADSPWYPTARLFRQVTPGDWAPVVRQVSQYLETVQESNSARVEQLIR
jgi:hypothetical protein